MAHPINEQRQQVLTAKAVLNGLLAEQVATKGALSELFEKQAKGDLKAEEAATVATKVTEAQAKAKELDGKIAANRNLVQTREEQLQALVEKLENEKAEADATIAAEAAGKPAAAGGGVTLITGEKKGFKSLGEQLVAIAQASMPGHTVDSRLLAGPTGLSEGVPADGGYFVQQDTSQELLKKTFDIGRILQLVKKVTVQGNGLKVNAVADSSRANGSRWGGVQAFWQGEADTKSATKPAFRPMDLNLKKLTTLCYATDELLQDAAALEGVFMEAFSEEMSFKLEDAIINGSGAGMPKGIMASEALVTQAIEGSQTIANTAASIAVNLAKMWGRCFGRSQQAAVWLINQELLNKLYTATLGGTSAVSGIFIAPGRFNETPYATVFGRPVIPIEYAGGEGTPGDIILADLGTYLLIDKGGMQNASSIHVRFANDETVFRGVYRADGAPTWNSPLTPFKGSATQSPYVVLGTRS